MGTACEWPSDLTSRGDIRTACSGHDQLEGDGVIDPEAGPLAMVGNPVKLGEVGYDPAYLPPPRLGEHSEEILAEAGYSSEECAALLRKTFRRLRRKA